MTTNKAPLSVLEIGVNNGGSLEIWNEVLPVGSIVRGIDVDEKCQALNFSEGIKFYLGDASSQSFIEENFANVHFDIIVDDGSHLPHHIINSFELLFPKLNCGGFYIVEDCHTAYWKKYKGGFRDQNSYVEYFKNLVEAINFRRIEKEDYRLFINEFDNLSKLCMEIASITFYESIIVIEKYIQPMKVPFKPIVSDGEALVTPHVKERVKNIKDIPYRKFYRS